jgi:hypothetical protein
LHQLCTLSAFFSYFDCFAPSLQVIHSSAHLIVLHQLCKMPTSSIILIVLHQLYKLITLFIKYMYDCLENATQIVCILQLFWLLISVVQVVYILQSIWLLFKCFANCLHSSVILFVCVSCASCLHSSFNLIVLHQLGKLSPFFQSVLIFLLQLCKLSTFLSLSDCFASSIQILYILQSVCLFCILQSI